MSFTKETDSVKIYRISHECHNNYDNYSKDFKPLRGMIATEIEKSHLSTNIFSISICPEAFVSQSKVCEQCFTHFLDQYIK